MSSLEVHFLATDNFLSPAYCSLRTYGKRAFGFKLHDLRLSFALRHVFRQVTWVPSFIGACHLQYNSFFFNYSDGSMPRRCPGWSVNLPLIAIYINDQDLCLLRWFMLMIKKSRLTIGERYVLAFCQNSGMVRSSS